MIVLVLFLEKEVWFRLYKRKGMRLMFSADLWLNRPGDLLKRDRGWGNVCNRAMLILS